MANQASNTLRSTEKTIQIIGALEKLDGAGVTELAEHLGYTKSTVHHHLSTLEEAELVTSADGSYELGIRFFGLGEYVRRQRGIYEVAKPEVDTLAAETGELANLMIEEHGRGTYIHIAKGDQAVNLDTSTGTTQYLHTCALGKSMLAEMPDSRVESIIEEHGLPAETPNTVTSESELFEELEQIRDQGVAYDGEERAEAITCVATSVTNSSDELLGAISISGPSARMQGKRIQDQIPSLLKDASEIIGINASYS